MHPTSDIVQSSSETDTLTEPLVILGRSRVGVIGPLSVDGCLDWYCDHVRNRRVEIDAGGWGSNRHDE